MKILIIAPSWVGDLVMSQVLFKILKAQFPASQIDVVALPILFPLLNRMPEVNELIALPIDHGQFNIKLRYQLGKRLRHIYEQAYVLPNSWKSALIPFFAKIPKRIGFIGEGRFWLLNRFKKLDKKKLPLMIDRFAFLADTLHPSAHYYPQLTSSKLPLNQPCLILCPGAAYGSAKRWPADYFAKVAQAKLKDGWQVWLLGAKGDAAACTLIAELCPGVHNFCGQTTLDEMLDLMTAATAVMSNDSGPMHIAASLNKPLIAIFGSSTPNFTPPLSTQAVVLQRTDLPCRPCFKRDCPLGHLNCLRMIQPEAVLQHLQNPL